MPIAQRYPCRYILDYIRSFNVQEWRNGGRVSHTCVVCELSPCHVPGEEDGTIRDTTVHRRGGGVVSPPGLRWGLLTVGNIDTIYHNPSSTTSAEYVHGTTLSLFQARTTMDDGQERDI